MTVSSQEALNVEEDMKMELRARVAEDGFFF
jgi:hypothetical protein